MFFKSVAAFFVHVLMIFGLVGTSTPHVIPPEDTSNVETHASQSQNDKYANTDVHLVAAGQGNTPASNSRATNTSSQISSSGGNATLATYGHVYTEAELLALSGPADLTKLPLGDGKYSTTGPKKGYVYICHYMTGGQGAQVNGPWIHGTTWDYTEKVNVLGDVNWPNAYATITTSGDTRTIKANDLPIDHETGTFPVGSSDPAAQYDRNQSSITEQNNNYSLPANPTVLSSAQCINGMVGVMIDGVTLNDAFDALYRDAPAHEVQDKCDGHPNNEEGYHDHNLSPCIKNATETSVIGWAFDGFPITGPEVATNKYLSTDDLDECHGLTSTITVNGKQVTTYHYVMTYDFPYSISCFRGKSYEPKPGGGSQGGGQTQQNQQGTNQTTQQSQGPQGGPPQEAITACSGKSSGASCSFATPQGDQISGHCDTPPNSSLACVPH